tara:strand:- start:4752 stop:5435 length:684 start_codon:yes stop_codon:yes gene_type:complete
LATQRPRVKEIRDRIKEFRKITVGELKENPKNWRTHSDWQKSVFKSVMESVGFAGTIIAYESERNDNALTLIDGHMRIEEIEDTTEVPVLILDVNDEEADLLLATYDPIGSMAASDSGQLADLLRNIQADDVILSSLLRDIDTQYGINELIDKEILTRDEEWEGMPEFSLEDQTAYRQVIVSFQTPNDVEKFAELVGQQITPKTKQLWFPPTEKMTREDKRWISEDG